MRPIVAFDESGNTGSNLFDQSQPVFALASVSVPDDLADYVLGSRDRELKFSERRKRPARFAEILRILNSPDLERMHYYATVVHKKHMVCAKMVDLLAEPLLRAAGVNLYEKGLNIAYANVLFVCIPAQAGTTVFDILLERFAGMIGGGEGASTTRFYKLLRTMERTHRRTPLRMPLSLLLKTEPIARRAAWSVHELDPALPSFFLHAAEWTGRLNGNPFTIVHDASRTILKNKDSLELLMSEDGERKIIGFDRRKILFPIASREITFEDSAAKPQIQLADIIAGAVFYAFRCAALGIEDSFAEEICKSRIVRNCDSFLWPSMNVMPADLGTDHIGGVDLNDHISSYLATRSGSGGNTSSFPQ